MRGLTTRLFAVLTTVTVTLACVDTSRRKGSTPAGPEPIVTIDTEPVPDELRARPDSGPYAFRNVGIMGGGFVTGLVFSSAVANLIFARTDVGGAYRYSVADQRWYPLLDWVGQDDVNLLGVESIALDPRKPERVYLAAGTYLTAGNGALLRSDDFGESFTRFALPTPMGGNANGRSMGERLAVDPSDPDRLFFGSRNAGLWASRDAGETFRVVDALPAHGDDGLGISFVQAAGAELYVGIATVTGPSLYRSRDGGESFEAVPGAPQGMMPHHAAPAPDGPIYFAYNDGPGPNDIKRGAIWRLDPEDDSWTDVSPRRTGFGGVTVDRARPGVVMATTIDVWAPDQIFRSVDGGENWLEIGASAQHDAEGAEWLNFGGSSPSATGWMGDLEIDPFNRSRVLYVTGQGVWWSDDVTDTDAGLRAHFGFQDRGLEETVALDLASPPSGAPLLTALGDIGGFRHDDLDVSPPAGMFEQPLFANTSSIDFAEAAPELVLRVGTGDHGHGAVSHDGGASFEPLPKEPQGGGAGSIAVASDGAVWLWSPDRGTAARSTDAGSSWVPCGGLELSPGARVVSDRVNPELFYAVDRQGVYVSHDAGKNFTRTDLKLPPGARLRSVFGREGHFWLSSSAGLYRSVDAGATVTEVDAVGTTLGVGFGRPEHEGDYPAIYLSGKVDGSAGLYRSDDEGQSFSLISDDQHRFGWVAFITGDQRKYGRVYLGTGGRGVIYGDPR